MSVHPDAANVDRRLESIASLSEPVVVVVLDDGGFGSQRKKQREGYGRNVGVDYDNPDIAAIAAAMGIEAMWIESVEDVADVCRSLPGPQARCARRRQAFPGAGGLVRGQQPSPLRSKGAAVSAAPMSAADVTIARPDDSGHSRRSTTAAPPPAHSRRTAVRQRPARDRAAGG